MSTRCPLCGGLGYLGLTSFECSTGGCRNFKARGGAFSPENVRAVGTLFGIDAHNYQDWKAAKYPADFHQTVSPGLNSVVRGPAPMDRKDPTEPPFNPCDWDPIPDLAGFRNIHSGRVVSYGLWALLIKDVSPDRMALAKAQQEARAAEKQVETLSKHLRLIGFEAGFCPPDAFPWTALVEHVRAKLRGLAESD